jgi:hypothetical protein
LPEGVTGDRKFGMSLKIFADSEWNYGKRRINDVRFTGASAKPEIPPICFDISVRPSKCNNEASTGRLYVEFDIGDSNKNLSKISKIYYNGKYTWQCT